MGFLQGLHGAFDAAFRSSPVEHVDAVGVGGTHAPDVVASLAEPAGFVADQAVDATVAGVAGVAQDQTSPDPEPLRLPDGDPLERGWQLPGDHLGPDDGPHWTVSPFAPDVPLVGDPIDLDTVADLADVTGTVGLPDLIDDAGLGDAVV